MNKSWKTTTYVPRVPRVKKGVWKNHKKIFFCTFSNSMWCIRICDQDRLTHLIWLDSLKIDCIIQSRNEKNIDNVIATYVINFGHAIYYDMAKIIDRLWLRTWQKKFGHFFRFWSLLKFEDVYFSTNFCTNIQSGNKVFVFTFQEVTRVTLPRKHFLALIGKINTEVHL